MNIFSFCLYGTDLKYYLGLHENLKLINEHFPDHYIYIYVGKTRLNDYISDYMQNYLNVRIIETYKEGAINTLYRYKPISLSNLKNVIIRDSDSDDNDGSDSEKEEMDMHEYRKFISKIFPSKHMNKKVEADKKQTKREMK